MQSSANSEAGEGEVMLLGGVSPLPGAILKYFTEVWHLDIVLKQ